MKIKLNNAKARASGNKDHKRMGHNRLSDKTKIEKLKLLGYIVNQDNPPLLKQLMDDRAPL